MEKAKQWKPNPNMFEEHRTQAALLLLHWWVAINMGTIADLIWD